MAVKQELCTGCAKCEEICAETFFKVTGRDKSAIRVDALMDGGYQVAFCNQCGECIAVARPRRSIASDGSFACGPRAASAAWPARLCPDLVMYVVPETSCRSNALLC